MLTDQEIQILKRSRTKAEAMDRAGEIRRAILRTFSENSPHRKTLLGELDEFASQISASLPEANAQGLKRGQKEELIQAKVINRHEQEELEFSRLVDEVKTLGFTKSQQVSTYIIANNLSAKYQYISGILEMERDQDIWQYRGGFPPHIYARLCDALGLGRKDSRARVKNFRPFSDVQNTFKA